MANRPNCSPCDHNLPQSHRPAPGWSLSHSCHPEGTSSLARFAPAPTESKSSRVSN